MKTAAILALLPILVVLVSCGQKSASSALPPDNAPKVGGVYATKSEDETYRLSKVLVADEFSVHLRMYADKFDSLPTAVDTSKLNIAIGHAPLAVEGFLNEPRSLIKVESVADSELEGYKIYLEAMGEK